jgi:hypothetical protein
MKYCSVIAIFFFEKSEIGEHSYIAEQVFGIFSPGIGQNTWNQFFGDPGPTFIHLFSPGKYYLGLKK